MTVTEKTAALMREQIHQGVFRQGQKLPSRFVLKERYGISRSSIDKVISMLVDEGLLTSKKGSGTFVRASEETLDASAVKVKVSLVMNTSSGCIESGFFERNWQQIISEDELKPKATVLSSETIPEMIDLILGQPGHRMIWSRPPFSALSYIDRLEQHGVPQVLVNRMFPDYNYFANDTKKGLKECMKLIHDQCPEIKLAMLSSPMDPGLPYLAEREIAYHEACQELAMNSLGTFRMSSYAHHHMMDGGTALLSSKANAVFVNDHDCVAPLVSLLYHSGLILGEDVSIITMDWLDGKKATKGIYCIRQNWSLMFEMALEWAQSNHPDRRQELVEPDLIYVEHDGDQA
jgi:DNA-binding transcriptional regulator YhcF (GntR family)